VPAPVADEFIVITASETTVSEASTCLAEPGYPDATNAHCPQE
jgi:hypothetical protein